MGLFSDVFGFPWDYPYGNAPIGWGPMQQASAQAQMNAYSVPQKLLEPGIEWERTGPRQHRVTIRTKAEWVTDYGKLAEWQQRAHLGVLNVYNFQKPVP